MADFARDGKEQVTSSSPVSSPSEKLFDETRATSPDAEPTSNQEPKDSRVPLSPAFRQENNTEGEQITETVTTNIFSPGGGAAPSVKVRAHRNGRSQRPGLRGFYNLNPQPSLQERRFSRRQGRSEGGQSQAPWPPVAPAFVPLALPVTQPRLSGYNIAHVPSNTPDPYGYYAPPIQIPTLFQGGQLGYTDAHGRGWIPLHVTQPTSHIIPPPGLGFYGQNQYQQTPGRGGVTYQGVPPMSYPSPPRLGASLGNLLGTPAPPLRPFRVQQYQARNPSQRTETAAPRPQRVMTQEEIRNERICVWRQQHERARGFDEQDDEDFIPNL